MAVGPSVTELPPALSDALIAFNNHLAEWLDQGGEDRLIEFEPLDSWLGVVKLLAWRSIQ